MTKTAPRRSSGPTRMASVDRVPGGDDQVPAPVAQLAAQVLEAVEQEAHPVGARAPQERAARARTAA